jgi:hypothetical protein
MPAQMSFASLERIAHMESGFGNSLALSLDERICVIGSPRHTEDEVEQCGAISIYQLDNGSYKLILSKTASDKTQFALFGSQICVSEQGDSIAVIARGDKRGKGAVYYFTRKENDWEENFKISQDGEDCCGYPLFIAMSGKGDDLLIGGKDNEEVSISLYSVEEEPVEKRRFVLPKTYQLLEGVMAGNGSRFAFCFKAPNCELLALQIITKTDEGWKKEKVQILKTNQIENVRQNKKPAMAISYDGTTVAISSNNANCVLIFSENDEGWSKSAEIGHAHKSETKLFVSSLALNRSGSSLFVGAPFHRIMGVSQGAVLVYHKRDNYKSNETMHVPGGNIDDHFGNQICSSNNGSKLLVGSETSRNGLSNTVYICNL